MRCTVVQMGEYGRMRVMLCPSFGSTWHLKMGLPRLREGTNHRQGMAFWSFGETMGQVRHTDTDCALVALGEARI